MFVALATFRVDARITTARVRLQVDVGFRDAITPEPPSTFTCADAREAGLSKRSLRPLAQRKPHRSVIARVYYRTDRVVNALS